jgi:hypothetical protein
LLGEGLGLHNDALRWAGRASLADFDLGMHSGLSAGIRENLQMSMIQ